MKTPQAPKLLTSAQVATELGVTTRTVTRYVEDEMLAAELKLPGPTGAYLFTRASVDAFKTSQETTS